MAEYNPLKEDAAKAEAIRRRYMEKGTTKLDQLQALDAKVKTPGTVLSSMLGIVGALVMGTGMSNIMVWDNMTAGLALGIPGLLMLLSGLAGLQGGHRQPQEKVCPAGHGTERRDHQGGCKMKKSIVIGTVVCIIGTVAAGIAAFAHSRKGWC